MDEFADPNFPDNHPKSDPYSRGKTCVVCKHPEYAKIHKAYISWESLDKICEQFGFSRKVFNQHLCHRGTWQQAREANRRKMLMKIVEYGYENMDALGLKARDVINAIQWLDKLDGLVIDRKEINGPPTVNILAIPRPGGVLNKASQVQDELASAGPVVASYPRLKAPEVVEVERKEGTND